MTLMSATYSSPVTPEELRVRAGQIELPFNLKTIADTIGAEVYLTDFANHVKAMIRIEDMTPVIDISKSLSPHERRYMLAHEFGHLVLGHVKPDGQELIDDEARLNSFVWNVDERDAHRYAEELLVPLSLLKRALRSGIRDINDLVILFGVSKDVLRGRLARL